MKILKCLNETSFTGALQNIFRCFKDEDFIE